MNRQRGVSLSGMLFWSIGIALVAMLGIKVFPSVTQYYSIMKAIKSVASSSAGMTVPEIRKSFDRHANTGYISDITGAELDISKDSSGVVISFAYEKRVPLFGNVSLLIDYHGSSSGQSRGE